MSIKFNKVMIHGKNVTDRVKSISESDYGYRACFSDGACTFNKSDVNIFTCDTFDITKHEFSDKDIRLSNLCESKIELAVDDCGIEHYFTLHKSDAIAMAKSLGATGEDLK